MQAKMQIVKSFGLAAFLSGCTLSFLPENRPSPASPQPSSSPALPTPTPTPILDPLKVTIISSETHHPDLPEIRIPGLKLEVVAGSGQKGFRDGKASEAQFDGLRDLASDAQGNLYAADYNNHRIRKIATDGQVTTLAGSGTEGVQGGDFLQARFTQPYQILTVSPDLLYVLDSSSMIYALDLKTHQVSLAAYSRKRFPSSKFYSQEIADSTQMAYPGSYYNLAYQRGFFFVNDDFVIRIFSLRGEDYHYTGKAHDPIEDALNEFWVAKDGTSLEAMFRTPGKMKFDSEGALYVMDGSLFFRRVDPVTKAVSMVAGQGLLGRSLNWRSGTFDGIANKSSFVQVNDYDFQDSQEVYFIDDGRFLRLLHQGVLYTLMTNLHIGAIHLVQNTLFLSDYKFNRIYKMSLAPITKANLQALKPL